MFNVRYHICRIVSRPFIIYLLAVGTNEACNYRSNPQAVLFERWRFGEWEAGVAQHTDSLIQFEDLVWYVRMLCFPWLPLSRPPTSQIISACDLTLDLCTIGTHYGWVARGNMELEVYLTHPHMTSTGNRTSHIVILSSVPYIHSATYFTMKNNSYISMIVFCLFVYQYYILSWWKFYKKEVNVDLCSVHIYLNPYVYMFQIWISQH